MSQWTDFGDQMKGFGNQMKDGAHGLMDKLEARLTAEGDVSPAQRVANFRAEEAGAQAKELAAKRQLMACRDEAEKYQRYAKEAEEKGDSSQVRRYTEAMEDLAAKLPALEQAYQDAVAHHQAAMALTAKYEQAANPASPEPEVVPEAAPEAAPAPEPEAVAEAAPAPEPMAQPEPAADPVPAPEDPGQPAAPGNDGGDAS